MDYASAVESAPPGWRHFTLDDLDRLPAGVRAHEMNWVPAPERELLAGRDAAAVGRVLRALFWTLVYHLEPARWDALAEVEPIHPELLGALPRRVARAADVGAGSGRLTRHLVPRAGMVVAIEPSAGLRRILRERLPGVLALPGWAEHLPLATASFELTAACGSFGPQPEVLDELDRVTAPGGVIALISPESPEWFEAHGWRRITTPAMDPTPHAAWIDEFFGPPSPPRELVLKMREP